MAALFGVPILLLLSIEACLRLAHCGYPTSFFLSASVNGQPVWIENQAFGRRFFPQNLLRYPRSTTLSAHKSSKTLRVFVLGESAAMGDPEPGFGMPRMLEVLLRERFPEQEVEVVNAAMVAINSHAILPIARDCAKQDGDLWIIYMGNNEVIGPFGPLSVFGAKSPPLPIVRASLAVKTTRLGQSIGAFTTLFRRNPPVDDWGGMTMWANQGIRESDSRRRRVYENFRSNLMEIINTGQRAGVAMIICTVPVNVRDCAPFGSLHRTDLSAADLAEWEVRYQAGKACEAEARFTEAAEFYAKAALLDADFADLAYRQGRCAVALGQRTIAEQYFAVARDRDTLQFRTDTRINQIIRECAAARKNAGVLLLDAERRFLSVSPPGGIGHEFFYEHVHLNPEGNFLLANAIAAEAVGALEAKFLRAPKAAKDGALASTHLSEFQCLAELGFTEWNRHDILRRVFERITQSPFTQQLNHAENLEVLREELEQSRSATKPIQVQRAVRQIESAVARHPRDGDIRWNFAVLLENAGEIALAERQWREVIALQPQAPLPYYNLARLLEGQAREAEARLAYEQCLKRRPAFFDGLCQMGVLLMKQGQYAEALRYLRLAVHQQPRSPAGHLALARCLDQLQRKEAESEFQEGLRLGSGHPQSARPGIQRAAH